MSEDNRDFVVLTGHGIGTQPDYIEDTDPDMWISIEHFGHALELLSRETLLTFDDGFSCCWDIAFPELQRRGIKAKFFVIVGNLGKKGYLTAEQVKEMSRAGMAIGTHGMKHRPWYRLNEPALREEIFEAKEQLEALIEKPVTEAACPFGAYDRSTLHALKRSGISTVYTSDRIPARSGSWIVPRYTIRSSVTQEWLKCVVSGKEHVSLVTRAKLVMKRWR